MLPATWLEYVAKCESEIKRTPTPTKRQQPRIKRMQSGRMKVASSQSPNFVHSVYVADASATPIRKTTEGLTRDLGGNCEDKNGAPTGVNTSYRKAGMNKNG